jgi:hypothetical protein
MDWPRAIAINKEALTRIVAALVSLLASQGQAKVLPLPVYQLLTRVLRPAESALRRLIIIAARGLTVPAPSVRPMPKGLVIPAKGGTGPMAFKLFDTRKRFTDEDDDDSAEKSGPRIRTLDTADPRSQFLALFKQDPDSKPNAEQLTRRLMAVKRALETLPYQAKRMARWRARRALMKNPKFVNPLRPGPPPGRRKHGKDEIDKILVECHALAWDALRPNTS